jgi:diguanylate cyclase (GGDEF)-like protein
MHSRMRNLPKLLFILLLLNAAEPVTAVPATASPVTEPSSLTAATRTVLAARKIMMNDPAAALAIGIDLEHRASKVPDARERQIVLAKARWIAGEASLRLNRVDAARQMIEASYSLSVAAGDPQSQGDSLLSRGAIKSESGDPAGALQDYLTAHKLFERTVDFRSQSIALQNMSELYVDARDYKRAETYLHQAGDIYRGEPLIQLALANNIGNLNSELGRFADAERQYGVGLAIARRLGLHALELQLLSNLALAQIKQKRLPAAAQTVQQITATSRRTRTAIAAEVRATIAHLAFAQGDVALARAIADETLKASGRKTPVLDEDIHYNAYEIYKAAGETGLALAQLEIASRLRNEAVAVGISNKAALMAAQFDYATQDLRISALKTKGLQRDMELARESAARQRTIFNAVGILVLVIIAMMAAWLESLRRSRNHIRAVNMRLEQANSALEAALQEVGQRTLAAQQATRLARHDALTGLPNRRHLDDEVLEALRARTDAANDIFLLLLDLDRFKPINDIHGHAFGDMVLVETANRLSSLCNRIEALAVRLGGDEFVVLMSAAPGENLPGQVANDIILEIGEPIYVGGQRLTVGASVGIARYPQDGTTIGDLLRAADNAMYEAKRSGRNKYCLFDATTMAVRTRLRVI